jgi:uncharacterized protein YjiK
MNFKSTAGPLAAALSALSVSAQLTSIDLSQYQRVGRYSLPDPSVVSAPAGNFLAQEASGVAYNPDTGTLFVVGDGGRSITQVSKTGQLIDTMTLGPGPSPQGTLYFDIEGIAYAGGGKFIVAEERYRQVNLLTYAAGTTINTKPAQSEIKLGTTIGNVGIEGISFDPATGGIIAVKELNPQGIFQTSLNFAAGTASNGSAVTVNSLDLFNPALMGLGDTADVFAMSQVIGPAGSDYQHLLVLSQESGKIVEVDRLGNIYSTLTITATPGDLLAISEMQHEGLTMDEKGFLYVVNENGGGDINHPELWVYAPVPEPSEYALMAGGALAAFGVVRRWRRASTQA